MSFSVISVECPEYVVPNTRFKVTVTITNEEEAATWFTFILTDLDTGQRLERFSGLVPAKGTASISLVPVMPDRDLSFELRVQNSDVDTRSFIVYKKVAEEPPEEPPPLPCIIATVFLGENHPLLQPLRNFRDMCLDGNPLLSKMYGYLLEIYYRISVFFLRKMGKLSDEN